VKSGLKKDGDLVAARWDGALFRVESVGVSILILSTYCANAGGNGAGIVCLLS
jgi:hypothetical protein